MEWSDIKYFLAMVEAGSLSSAAKSMRVSQPTLSRRLTALEESLGASVFSRKSSGLELTAEGESLLSHAQLMSDQAVAIERIASGQDQRLSGSVCITVVESIGAEWLTCELFKCRELYPNIDIEMRIEDTSADLMRHEADIAIRMYRPTQPDLIAKKVAHMHYGTYTSQSYIDRKGTLTKIQDIREHDMVLPTEATLQFLRPVLKKSNVELGKPAFSSNSSTAIIAALRQGYGIGFSSSLTAMRYPDLIPIFPEHRLHNDIWLVTHADLRRSARIRAVYDFISDLFKGHKLALAKDENGDICDEPDSLSP